jgi:hypothetical protein
MTTEVQDAERDVAQSKQLFQESLRQAGETGTRLAVEVRNKMTPTLVVAAVVGAAAVGVAVAIARGNSRPRRRAHQESTLAGKVARAAGMWLLRTVALRVAAELAAKLREPQAPALAQSRHPS